MIIIESIEDVLQHICDIEAVIFDLDDTLYSEKEYVRSGFKCVSDYLGGGYEKRLWDLFINGKPAIDYLLTELGKQSDSIKAIEIYRSHIPDIHLYPGVLDLLKDLELKGYRIGIITDGRPNGQRNKLTALGLSSMIRDIIVTDELGGVQFRKPCDKAYRLLQAKWDIPFEKMMYVGDNPKKDFIAPEQLGMQSLWFKNSDGLYSGGK